MKIILIGFMGSGKSSVTRTLSQLLQLPLLEMDEVVYQKTDTKSMHEVFAKGGELLLRETEIVIAREYMYAENLLISTGAGIVMNKIILDYLKHRNAKVFFLNASLQLVTERLAGDVSRPLFKDQGQIKSLYDLRQPLYLAYADKVVDVKKKSIHEIAQEIAADLRKTRS